MNPQEAHTNASSQVMRIFFFTRKCAYAVTRIRAHDLRPHMLLPYHLTVGGIWIPQVHRITAVALHLRVFQGIVYFLREALWLKSIEESNDKLY